MITLNEIKVNSNKNSPLSLVKLVGKQIKDITFRITGEFGDLVIDIGSIIFEDDSTMIIDGEHEIAYLYTLNQPNTDEETLESLYEEQGGEWT